MTGAELLAGATALARFQAEEVGSDVKNYTIDFHKTEEEIEVIFIPNQGPEFPKKIEMGGKTVFGRGVHYIVSTKNNEVLRRFFDR